VSGRGEEEGGEWEDKGDMWDPRAVKG
jgi:hypothetical protein